MLVNLHKTFKYAANGFTITICHPGLREIPAPYCDIAISGGFGSPADETPPKRAATRKKRAKK